METYTSRSSQCSLQPEDYVTCLKDDEEFEVGEGVDEMVQRLESGLNLPPDPRQEGLVPETSEEYIVRIEQLKAAFEASYLPKKDWEVRLPDFPQS